MTDGRIREPVAAQDEEAPRRKRARRAAPAAPSAAAEPPLVVDVDGTLIRTDLLFESAIHLAMKDPLAALRMPLWLRRGKAHLKTEIADRVAVEVHTLPVDPDVLAFMQSEKARGRRIVLASASDHRSVKALAEHIGCVDQVFATDAENNLAGDAKRRVLVEAFGEGGFDYIGNSDADVPVWQAARRGYVVRSGWSDPARAYRVEERPLEILAHRPLSPRTLVKAARLHQWAKNLLLFVPLVLGGALADPGAVLRVVACFIAFGLLASGTYIANDLIDIANDRKHRVKRNRPLANGDLSIPLAIGMVAAGAVAGLGIAAFLGLPVFLGLVGYTALTLAYSWRLKRVPIVDTTLLAGLYTWRLFVGILAANVILSPWLLVFSFAFFLSLSLAKRHTEISGMAAAGHTSLPGRGYRTVDGPFVMTMGLAAGVSSVLIFVLYMIEGAFQAAFFSYPAALWAVPVILLMWLCRVWLLCGREELHDDPVEFAIHDRKSLILGAMAGAAVAIALFG